MKFKKLHPDASISAPVHAGDAGYDLTVTSVEPDPRRGIMHYGTGIAVEIPEGYVGLLVPRSSVVDTNLSLANSVGVIDSSFRGEIQAKFIIRQGPQNKFKVGDKFCQLVIVKNNIFDLEEVETLSETSRDDGAFGSTN